MIGSISNVLVTYEIFIKGIFRKSQNIYAKSGNFLYIIKEETPFLPETIIKQKISLILNYQVFI